MLGGKIAKPCRTLAASASAAGAPAPGAAPAPGGGTPAPVAATLGVPRLLRREIYFVNQIDNEKEA